MAILQSSATPAEIQHPASDGNLLFPAAADAWLEAKKQQVNEGTGHFYEVKLRPLTAFFGNLKLGEIHIGHITEYRRWRQEPHEYEGRILTAGPNCINQEISTLSQILDRAGLWVPIARHYKAMRRPRKGPGQRIPLDELKHLLAVAQRKNRWKLAYLCSLVSANTAAGPGEILNLRIGNLNFNTEPPTISFVEGTKRDGERVRTLPMTEDCEWAIRQLLEIARGKGCVASDHYLLPARARAIGAAPDPKKRMGSYRKAWEALRKEAAKKFARLAHVRRYDLRHTALTMMAEDPNVDLPTLKKVAGHGSGSRVVLDTYFHESMQRKHVAVSALNGLRDAEAAARPTYPVELTAAASISKSPAFGSTWTSTTFGKGVL